MPRVISTLLLRSKSRAANLSRRAHYRALTFSSISDFMLSSPIVGYMTAAEFHVISLSVSSKEKRDSRVARTISATS